MSPVSLQTVLGQTAYMLFYAQEKKGSKTNGVKVEGTKSAPVQMKRSRPDADDMEDINTTKVKSTEEVSKDKRVKVEEGLGLGGVPSELTKAERKKLKLEKRREKVEQEKGAQKPLNDYELATSAKVSSSLSTPSSSSSAPTSFASSASAVKSIFGVPIANVASSGTLKNLSPLADLDFKPLKMPMPKATTPVKKAETVVVEGWKVTEGVPKSPVAVDIRSLQNGKSEKEGEYVQDGWTVRVATKVIDTSCYSKGVMKGILSS